MKNARAKCAKMLFFIVKYANLWGFCSRRRRGCLSSLLYVHFHVVIMCIKAILGSLKNDGAKDNDNAINQRYENKILLHVQHAL